MSMFHTNGLIITPRILTSVQESAIVFQEGMIWYNVTLKSLRLRLLNTTINLASTTNLPTPDGGNFLTEVATQADMLALVGSVGDYAYRTDLNRFFIISSLPPTVLANWSPFSLQADINTRLSNVLPENNMFVGNASNIATATPGNNSIITQGELILGVFNLVNVNITTNSYVLITSTGVGVQTGFLRTTITNGNLLVYSANSLNQPITSDTVRFNLMIIY